MYGIYMNSIMYSQRDSIEVTNILRSVTESCDYDGEYLRWCERREAQRISDFNYYDNQRVHICRLLGTFPVLPEVPAAAISATLPAPQACFAEDRSSLDTGKSKRAAQSTADKARALERDALLALAAGAEVVLSRNNSNDSGDGDPGAVVLQNPSLDSGLDDLLYRQPQPQVRAQVQSFDDFPID
jgi:hypothetical protein